MHILQTFLLPPPPTYPAPTSDMTKLLLTAWNMKDHLKQYTVIVKKFSQIFALIDIKKQQLGHNLPT